MKMPSKSKSQQRFFGLVHKCKKTGECISPKIKKVADNISDKDAKDFAKTKHKGLPNKVKRKRKTFKEYVESKHPDFYEENALGLLANLGLGAAAIIKTMMGKKPSGSIDHYIPNKAKHIEEKDRIWTNKNATEHKEGIFIKKENNLIYIKLKNGIIEKTPIYWFSEQDLKYIELIQNLNKKENELESIKIKINSTEDEIAKNDLIKKYKQIEAEYKQIEIKIQSFDN
jgi:hypothetical protein